MDIQRFLKFLRTFAWVVILASFLCAVAGLLVSKYLLTPQYQVSATVLVYKSGDGKQELFFRDILVNEKLVSTFRDIASSRRVMELAMSRLSMEMSLNQFASKINIFFPDNSQVLSITVKDTSLFTAIEIANQMAFAFQQEMHEILPDQRVVVIDLAKDIGDVTPISPNTKLNTVIAGLLGFAFSSFILMLIEYIRRPIRTEEEAHEAAAAPVLAYVYKAEPACTDSEEFHSLATQLLAMQDEMPVQSLVVTSAVRESGTTTVATNLAIALAQANQKVLLIDANIRHPLLHHLFHLPNKQGLYDLLATYTSLESVVQETAVSSLSVITSGPVRPGSLNNLNGPTMPTLLRQLSETYDYIVFDAPAMNAYSDTQNILRFTDSCLLSIRANLTTMNQVRIAHKRMQSGRAKLIGSVLTQYHPV